VFGSATLTDTGQRLRVPHELLAPTFDGLVRRGFALHAGGQERSDPGNVTGGQERSDPGNVTGGQERSDPGSVTDGRLWLTQAGVKQVDASFEGHADREQVGAPLERIAHRMLVQRGWDEERALAGAAG